VRSSTLVVTLVAPADSRGVSAGRALPEHAGDQEFAESCGLQGIWNGLIIPTPNTVIAIRVSWPVTVKLARLRI
jgi:hypothetical protein